MLMVWLLSFHVNWMSTLAQNQVRFGWKLWWRDLFSCLYMEVICLLKGSFVIRQKCWKTTFRSRQRGDDTETIVRVFCLILNLPPLHFGLSLLKPVSWATLVVFERIFFAVNRYNFFQITFQRGRVKSGCDLVQKLPTPESKLLVFHFSLESLKHLPNFSFIHEGNLSSPPNLLRIHLQCASLLSHSGENTRNECSLVTTRGKTRDSQELSTTLSRFLGPTLTQTVFAPSFLVATLLFFFLSGENTRNVCYSECF